MAPRLGADFTKLWSASTVSNIGDGMTMAAGPLLLASLTDDPALVAGAVFVQQLPWLLFSLFSGVVVDRLDRRGPAVAANLGRGAVIGALAVTVGAGQASIPVVYACLFLLGVGATIADTASAALVPAVVPDEHLPRANSRMMSTQILGGRMAAPPVAGATLTVFGLYAVVWNVIMRSVQQRQVPDELRGRAGGALLLLVIGGSAVGALIGGALAREFGITSPFWLGAVVTAGVTVVAWRPFAAVAGLNRPATTTT